MNQTLLAVAVLGCAASLMGCGGSVGVGGPLALDGGAGNTTTHGSSTAGNGGSSTSSSNQLGASGLPDPSGGASSGQDDWPPDLVDVGGAGSGGSSTSSSNQVGTSGPPDPSGGANSAQGNLPPGSSGPPDESAGAAGSNGSESNGDGVAGATYLVPCCKQVSPNCGTLFCDLSVDYCSMVNSNGQTLFSCKPLPNP